MRTKLHGGKSNFLLAIMVVLFAGSFCLGQEQPFSINTSPLPAPTGFVNDFAGVVDQETKNRLETRLKEFKEKTNPTIEIAVAVIRTTGGRELSEYSLAVARGWGIGSKEDDNPSALLMVAIDDRKYFTQISKDLEDELPDGVVGSLQRQFLVPEFKKGNYSKGISDTVEAYIATIENRIGPGAKPTPPTVLDSPADQESLLSTFCCMAIILVIILIILSRSNRGGGDRNDRDRWGGGGFGGGGGALPWIIGSIIANAGSSSGSSSSDWGGSSGGGGFGGFGGGGDFGGGGAGGDW